MRSPILLPIRMKAAETNASSAMADCTPLAVVCKSLVTAEIDTFISEVSTTRTNIAMDSRIASRMLPAVLSGAVVATLSIIRCRPPPGHHPFRMTRLWRLRSLGIGGAERPRQRHGRTAGVVGDVDVAVADTHEGHRLTRRAAEAELGGGRRAERLRPDHVAVLVGGERPGLAHLGLGRRLVRGARVVTALVHALISRRGGRRRGGGLHRSAG